MPPLRIAFRADAATWIGTGHVMRCATLAERLRAEGAEILFISRQLPGDCCDWLAGRGFDVHRLAAAAAPSATSEADAPVHAAWLAVPLQQERQEAAAALAAQDPFDWLVVDHYALGATWERAMRPHARRIFVIDDLADRSHDCELLLDQNLRDDEAIYARKVPEECRLLVGPGYALLRPEFAEARQTLRSRDGVVRRILVFFGGVDRENLTSTALEAIARLARPNIAVDVVIGPSNPRRSEIEQLCAEMVNVTSHWNVTGMAALLAAADVMLGAAGSITWERACLGLPALVVTVADNQRPIAAAAQRHGILTWLGDAAVVTRDGVVAALGQALGMPGRLRAEGARGLALVDGGGTARVVEAMQP